MKTRAQVEKVLYNEFHNVLRMTDSRIDGRLVQDHIRKLINKAYLLGWEDAHETVTPL